MKKYLLVTVLLLITSCASFPEKIRKNVNQADFDKALLLLEKKGVGTHLNKTPDAEALKAREIYESAVFDHYNPKVVEQLSQGHARAAYQTTLKAKSLCQWSPRILDLTAKLQEIVNNLNLLQKKWNQTKIDKEIPPPVARKIIADVVPIYDYIHDSPFLLELLEKSTRDVIDYWAEKILTQGNDLDPALLKSFEEFLETLPNIQDDKKTFISMLRKFSSLPNYKNRTAQQIDAFAAQRHEALSSLILYLSEKHPYEFLGPCHDSLAISFEKWCLNELSAYLENPKVGFELINQSESILSKLGFVTNERLQKALAKAHLTRAKLRAKDGKAALMALLHLRRCQALDPITQGPPLIELRNYALAGFSAGEPIKAKISISADQKVNPQLYDLLRIMFAAQICSSTKDYFHWKWRSSLEKNLDVSIRFEEIDLVATSYSDLETVSSSYLSHYESVPNPMKSALEYQLRSAEIRLNFAESSYNSAVSSHNIYPTQFSLMNVNNAYNNYVMATNAYNNLVAQYNFTPATISRPVYLPYSFKQGNISSGWRLSVSLVVSGHKFHFKKEEVDCDFVRIGAKYNDRSETYRSDDPLDIDVSLEALFNKLEILINDCHGEFSKALCSLDIERFPRVRGEEREVLLSLVHPFGIEMPLRHKHLDFWVHRTLTGFEIPSQIRKPPELLLKRSAAVSFTGMNLESFVTNQENYVCEVFDEFNRGSGTLISRDGIILTCAHILMGSEIRAKFNRGKLKGEYGCDIIFIDEINDVALLRAARLSSVRWATIRLGSAPIKGEEIIAIGNPTLHDGTASLGGVSRGIISNPEIRCFGSIRTVADITVASGSSGGPIFSKKTGELVAVVTAVGAEGLNIGRDKLASSGYFCLAAPSNSLTEWLGIRYGK